MTGNAPAGSENQSTSQTGDSDKPTRKTTGLKIIVLLCNDYRTRGGLKEKTKSILFPAGISNAP